MNAKEINRESGRIFSSLLLPSWAERSQEDQEDYGVDFEIELMSPNDKATGLIFKVQLKGTSVANFNDSGQLVYSGASVERFSYYLSKLQIPLIFFVCDVESGHCYWTRVQGNRQIERDHADALEKNQETFTIRIPVSQRIEKTSTSAELVIEAVEDSANIITLKGLQALKTDSIREHVENGQDVEKTEKRFRLFAGIAANEVIQNLLLAEEFDAACEKAKSLLDSSSETPEIRILGGWNLARCLGVAIRRRRSPGASFEAAKYKLGIASKMLEAARSKDCETRLKRYTCIYTRAARMQINGRVATALVASENMQAHHGDTLSGPFTRIQRMEVTAMLARDFFRLRNSLYRLGKDGFYSVMPYALSEVAESILTFTGALRLMGEGDLADGYVDALFDFVPFCLNIVRSFNNQDDIEAVLSSLGVRMIALANASDIGSMTALLQRYEAALDGEPEFKCLNAVRNLLRKQVEELSGSRTINTKPTTDELREYFADRAVELGINLNDPNDKIAEIVRIGLDDLDPTRVSKNCEHIHFRVSSYGMPAEMLGLTTAGSKRIVCLKHGHSIETLKLDFAYESFRTRMPWDKSGVRCDNCPDVAPHPDGWQWSHEWESEQHERYQKTRKDEEDV